MCIINIVNVNNKGCKNIQKLTLMSFQTYMTFFCVGLNDMAKKINKMHANNIFFFQND